MERWIKNYDTIDHTYAGQDIEPGAYVKIPDNRLSNFANSSVLLADIGSGIAIMAKDDSGNTNIPDVNEAINFLKNLLPQDVQLTSLTTGNKIPKVAVVKPDGNDFISIVSHEFNDKTTWFGQSDRETGVTLTGTGVGPYQHGSNDYWIDLTSGNVPDEDTLLGTYGAKIYDNAVEVTSGFTINYFAGTITFDSTPTGPITADYSRANGTAWVLKPDTGKKLTIQSAEIDFSIDSLIDDVSFNIWAYDPNDLPNKMIVNTRKYKTIKDVIKIANEIQVIEPIGNLTKKICRAVFNYSEVIELFYSKGMELQVDLPNGEEFTGEFSSVTVYCVIEDE